MLGSVAGCGVCFRFSARSIRPTDTAEDARIKLIMVPVLTMLAMICFTNTILWYGNTKEVDYPGITLLGTGCILWVLNAFTGILPIPLATRLALGCAFVAVLMMDLSSAYDLRPRWWPVIVILLDVCLLFGYEKTAFTLIGCTCLWIAVDRAEAFARFGLYYWGTFGHEELLARTCQGCAQPPCGEQVASTVNQYLTMCLPLLIDFYLTRGFSKNMNEQLRIVNSAIKLAEVVASALARYDVEQAEESIKDKEGELPEALERSYLQLLENLKVYKSYLPQSCLVVTAEEPENVEQVSEGESRKGTPRAASW
eukprot:Hpha_TRINITY_DN16071_c3_g10::TRINITY_DN16071_c3_g10_i1::g.121037::m.121037